MTEQIFFSSDSLQLEGLIDRKTDERAAIITHPHPQYGGDMYNPVVAAIQAAYSHKQYTTLRFNFRGTGSSEGQFDNGMGEQKDVLGAFDYLSQQGFTSIDLAGYSFGAWVNAQTTSQQNPFQQLILVSPPVDFIDFKNIKTIKNLSLVIVGTQDDFAAVDNIKKTVPLWNESAEIEVIDGADHFYWGAADRIVDIISACLTKN